jgi:RNAse (barnase) inhibitor barstar
MFDGDSFKDLGGFFVAFGKMINGEGGYFGKDFGSFDDCLFGGYGMETPCTIVWQNSSASKKWLGHEAYYKWCQEQRDKKKYLDEEGFNYLTSHIAQAKNNSGRTMFDQIIDSIKSVGNRSAGKVKIELLLND